MSKEPVVIQLSKGKLALLLIGSIIFVIIGVWILVSGPVSSNVLLDNPIVKYGAGIASILFFGFIAVAYIVKLFDTRPGLIIDEKGITDNASGVSAGFIPWGDVRHIYTTQVMNQKFIMIGVNNPEDYINRQAKFLKKKAMNYNFKNYGSPISITPNGLKMDFENLLSALNTKWEENKNNA
ncbi:STM3941 family protein [Flavobacterium sp. DGU11]|uniref:STM3941 family protein n=1 Tax=Flavobacterium arundinis TaxID=3139143 RepID=A0ABU9I202_9FLAO